jgi:hypothetical protein
MKNKLIALALIGLSQSALAAPLPTRTVGPFEFKDRPVTEALKEMFADTGIEVVPNNLPNIIISASGVQGSLPVVMDALAAHAGLTYMYNDNMIVVSQAKNSTVNIPVAPATKRTTSTMAPQQSAEVASVAQIQPEAPVAPKVQPVAAVTPPAEVKPVPAVAKQEVQPIAEMPPAAEAKVTPAVATVKPAVQMKRKPLSLPSAKVDEAAVPVEQAKPLVALNDVQPVLETKPTPAAKEKVAQSYHLKLTSGSGVKRLIESSARANGYALNWEGDDLYVKYDASYADTTYEGLLNQVLSSIKVNGYMTNNATNGRVIYVITK